MIKQVISFCTKVQEFEAQFHLDSNTPIEIAEQMALQFITYLGNVKAQVKAQSDAVQASEAPKPTEVVPEAPKE